MSSNSSVGRTVKTYSMPTLVALWEENVAIEEVNNF